ncbi:GNAT family N-acetyltransferase [Phaeobacter sp. QD34_3]|uniref:GNAT family N-acetyltransferase n=1 Tax=unclassified Phaeobacter TaxID=2621772 RepID=UPI00237F433B|nr:MULTISPECIES: GNAT family N-acetyltransferase [unclassified Phaeobacter]MDE4134480.1 GNAT family N-acetyltransferase [Phaeobacter sp. QD34_3]MDE4138130.1 GNAT family N-acetyltransferase [Phaeobacter sp. QD34_24]MDE4176423.1 GNAT family N-acetyltransferase [Phaeobacter sp. PT47_59]
MQDFQISPAHPGDPDAAHLIRSHVEQMAAQSPKESCHALDGNGLDSPAVAFFLLRNGCAAVAMGALKRLDDAAFELKSMHTLVEVRGSGAGRAMLEHLMDLARHDGATDIYLETGSTEYFKAARNLYESYGFVECAPFGDYVEDPWSTFMHLDLRAAS